MESKLTGFATSEGTHRYAERFKKTFPPSAFRKLGDTGLETSILGFGTYRIDDETPAHGAALAKALSAGCNLVDTSTNYSDGDSETCVGKTLQSLVAAKKISRDEVIIVSKVGYVQGKNLELASQKEKEGTPYPEMVKYMDGCWHCIHPDFISEQLDLSLQRLQMERVDVYLLHNPEYFLSDAKSRGVIVLKDLRRNFYQRMENAFVRLEEEVKKGRISCYGVSSNTLVISKDDAEATSLSEMMACAERAAKKMGITRPSFKIIQLPVNLLENGAVLEKNTGDSGEMTPLEYAKTKNLAVLVNRPLNAIIEGQLFRLANFPADEKLPSSKSLLQGVKELEDEFKVKIAPQINTSSGVSAAEFFQWAEELAKSEITLSLEQWRSIQARAITPRVTYLVTQLNDFMVGDLGNIWEGWRDRYLPSLVKLLKAIDNECAKRSEEISRRFSQRLDPLLPEGWRSATLSQKANGVLVNTNGVTAVLNGMRNPGYVDDSLAVMQKPGFKVNEKIYQALVEPTLAN